MAKENNPNTSAAVIIRKFEIETDKEDFSDIELFDILCDQIEYMMKYKMEYLLSLMYRMDVKEAKVDAALRPFAPDPHHIGLAKLVMARQKERNKTMEKYIQKPIENLEEGLEY